MTNFTFPFVPALQDITDINGQVPQELLEEVEEAAAALGKTPDQVGYADSEIADEDGLIEQFEDFVASLPRGEKANFPNIPGSVNVSSFNGQPVLIVNDHGMTKLWM